MKSKEKQADTANYWTDIDVVYVKRRITKNFIKIKTMNILALCFGIALVIGLSAITYFGFIAEGINIWTAVMFFVLLLFLLGTVFSLKDSLFKIKKINRNEFVLAEAKMRHLFEDVSTAEGPDLIGDSYVTYFCKASRSKEIRIKKHGTSEKNFSDNTKVYAAFLRNDGSIEEKPFMMFLGNDYQIEESITTI